MNHANRMILTQSHKRNVYCHTADDKRLNKCHSICSKCPPLARTQARRRPRFTEVHLCNFKHSVDAFWCYCYRVSLDFLLCIVLLFFSDTAHQKTLYVWLVNNDNSISNTLSFCDIICVIISFCLCFLWLLPMSQTAFAMNCVVFREITLSLHHTG